MLKVVATIAFGMCACNSAFAQVLKPESVERAVVEATAAPKTLVQPSSFLNSSDARWTLNVGMAQTCETCPPLTNSNAPWQFSARVGYATTGGFELRAGLVGNRGYTLPMFMDTTIGGEKRLTPSLSALSNLGATILWDATISGRAPLKRGEGASLGVVGDLFVPLSGHDRSAASPTSSGTATRGSTRVGLAIGY